jgi:hypothetical protein
VSTTQGILAGEHREEQVRAPVGRNASRTAAFIFQRSPETVRVVGESHCQDALLALGGHRGEEGVEWREHLAALVPEPSNPVDPMAIQVQINGIKVGYLGREDARAYRPVIERLGRHRRLMGAHALLTGGWDRGSGDVGRVGVELQIGAPAQLWREMDHRVGVEAAPGPSGR